MSEKVQRFVEERVLEMKDEIKNEVIEKVRKEVIQKITDEVTKKAELKAERNRLFNLKKNIISLMRNLKISRKNAMELLDVNPEDTRKILQIR